MKYLSFIAIQFIFITTSFAQPSNDDPCSATPIAVNTTCNYLDTDNNGATNSIGIPDPGCANFSGEDVWFSFVVPANGIVSINSTSGGITDGGMAVYSGNCNSLSLIECDDDDSENNNMPKIVLNGLTPGETMYIRFWDLGGGTGTFSICVATQPDCGTSPPAGNSCVEATPICDLNGYCGNTSGSYTENSWTNGGFLGIGGDGLEEIFCGTIENNSFLSFVASETSISFDVWVTSSVDGFGIQIFIFQSEDFCDGEVFDYGPCYNPSEVEPGAVTITAGGLTIGDTYYIMIDGQAGDVCDYVIGANSGFNLPVSIDPPAATLCVGDQVDLTASGGDGTYYWDTNPDLNTTSGNAVTATPSGSGVFTYTVNSTTGNVLCPASASATATITVENCNGCTVNASNSGPICAFGGTIDLFATAVGNATYTWTGPNGFTSTDQNPTGIAPPNSSGSHAYSVTVDSAGVICQSTTHVIVNDNPIVDAGNYGEVCSDQVTVALAGNPSGGTFSGTGVSSNNFDPASGTQIITYDYTDAQGCSSQDTALITIIDCSTDCSVNATNSGPICVNTGTIDLFATAVGNATYTWTGPNGFTSTDQNPIGVTTPLTPGNHIYTVIADSAGAICQSSTTVIVHALPNVDAGYYGEICDNETNVPLVGNPSGGTFSGAGVSSNNFDPTSGTQIITYHYTDAQGCLGQDTALITIVNCPSPCFVNASNSGPVCANSGTIHLFVSTVNNATYSWSGPNGFTSTDQNPSGVVPPTSAGMYTYTVVVDSAGTICQSTTDLTVHAIPTVDAGYYPSMCEGTNVLPLNGTPSGGVFSGTGVIGNNLTPTVGTQIVTYDYTNQHGCSAQDTALITIHPSPQVSFTADTLSGCTPFTVNFQSNSQSVSALCDWDFGNGQTSSSCGTTTTTYTAPGCYDITLTVSDNNCSTSHTIPNYICIDAYATAEFIITPDDGDVHSTEFEFINLSSNANSYTWDFGNGTYSNADNPSVVYAPVAGNQQVCLVANNSAGCSDTTCRTITIADDIIFYVPNTFTPDGDEHNQGFLPIFTSGFDPYDYQLIIFNRWGEIVWESFDHTVSWDGTYANSFVPDGTYTWKIEFKTTLNDERRTEVGHITIIR